MFLLNTVSNSFTKLFHRIKFKYSFLILGTVLLNLINHVKVLADTAPAKPADACNLGLACLQGTSDLTTGSTNDSIVGIITAVANILIYIGFAISIIFIVFQGYQMLTSNGDEKKYSQALRGILYVVLGMVILGFAYIIVQGVTNVISSIKV